MCLLQDAAFRLSLRCNTICQVCAALTFYTSQISSSKAHCLGLWSCKQEFLLQEEMNLLSY